MRGSCSLIIKLLLLPWEEAIGCIAREWCPLVPIDSARFLPIVDCHLCHERKLFGLGGSRSSLPRRKQFIVVSTRLPREEVRVGLAREGGMVW